MPSVSVTSHQALLPLATKNSRPQMADRRRYERVVLGTGEQTHITQLNKEKARFSRYISK